MLGSADAQATIPVKDINRAKAFYEQVLGLKPIVGSMPQVQAYRAGGSCLLVYVSEFAGTNQATAVTWSLGNEFDTTVQGLKAKGVDFKTYPIPGATMDGPVHVMGELRVAWFADPDGNIINLGNYPAP